MKVQFSEKDPKVILDKIKDAMGLRELGKIVTFDITNESLIVTIAKLGTSTLTFARTDLEDGLEFKLANEAIAFTHRAFKDDVTTKLKEVLANAGGKIS